MSWGEKKEMTEKVARHEQQRAVKTEEMQTARETSVKKAIV